MCGGLLRFALVSHYSLSCFLHLVDDSEGLHSFVVTRYALISVVSSILWTTLRDYILLSSLDRFFSARPAGYGHPFWIAVPLLSRWNNSPLALGGLRAYSMDPFLPPSQSPHLTAPAPGLGSWVDTQGNAARTSFPCHDPPPHLFPSSSNTNSTLVPKPTRRSRPHIPSSLSNTFSSAPLDTPTPTNINPILPHPNPLVAPFPIHPNICPPLVPLHPDTVPIRPAYTFVLPQHDVFHTPHPLCAPLALVELPRSPFTPPMSPLHHNLSRPPSVPLAQPIPPV
ncbi:hypothetical protein E4T56_gene13407, partial [Termitomyces sp. T112]